MLRIPALCSAWQLKGAATPSKDKRADAVTPLCVVAGTRFWVEDAKPPEDYIYENLHYSRFARYFRMVRHCQCHSVLSKLKACV